MVVATVLTVYGIETEKNKLASDAPFLVVATVLTVYGIETSRNLGVPLQIFSVATVLTVYGIETRIRLLPR